MTFGKCGHVDYHLVPERILGQAQLLATHDNDHNFAFPVLGQE